MERIGRIVGLRSRRRGWHRRSSRPIRWRLARSEHDRRRDWCSLTFAIEAIAGIGSIGAIEIISLRFRTGRKGSHHSLSLGIFPDSVFLDEVIAGVGAKRLIGIAGIKLGAIGD